MATALTVVQKLPAPADLKTKPAEIVQSVTDGFLEFQREAEKLGPMDFEALLSVRVRDEESDALAIAEGHRAKRYIELLDSPRDASHKLHKLFTSYTGALEKVREHVCAESRLWEAEKARRREALQSELRQAQEEGKRAAVVELEAKKQDPNVMPWDLASINRTIKAIENEPPVTLAEEPTPAGKQLRKAPDTYEIDWPVLLQACLENPELRELVLCENAKYLKTQLKLLGKQIAEKIPGVRLVEDTLVALV